MHSNRSIRLIVLLLAASGAAAQDKPPEQILKDAGLTKVGTAYLLDVDVTLPDKLRVVHQAENQLQSYTDKRQEIEGDIKHAQGLLHDLRTQMEDLDDQLKHTPAREALKYNDIVGQKNTCAKNINDGVDYIAQRQADLTKLVAPTDYVSATMDLGDQMDAAAKRYDELAQDPQIKQSLIAVSTGPIKFHLGPSAQFKQELPRLIAQRDKYKTMAIKLVMGGGVPHVLATINGTASVSMTVDSGAAVVTLSDGIASQAGIAVRKTDPDITLVTASGKKVKAKLTTIATIQVGPFTVKDVQCAVMPPEVAADCLLGGTFLRNFLYQMDLAAGELHLSPITAKATAEAPAHIPPISPPLAPSTAPAAPNPQLATPTSAPATRPVSFSLQIKATIDGSDDITITRDGLIWSHKKLGWPSEVQVGGQSWNPRQKPLFPSTNALTFLHSADLSKAHITSKIGRGTVNLETAAEGVIIHINDTGRGTDQYSVTLSFGDDN